MRVSRESFKFWILMLLGVVLFATAFLIFSRPSLPPYARRDVIEQRFAPQIARLREIAMTHTGSFTGAGMKQHHEDKALLAVPGILTAEVELAPDSSITYTSNVDDWYRSSGSSRRSQPTPHRPVISEAFYRPRDRSERAAIEYAGIVVRPDGSRREYTILFDLAELRSRWEAERGAEE